MSSVLAFSQALNTSERVDPSGYTKREQGLKKKQKPESEHGQFLSLSKDSLFECTSLPVELILLINEYANTPHSFIVEREGRKYCVLNRNRPYSKFLHQFSAMRDLSHREIPLFPVPNPGTGDGPSEIVRFPEIPQDIIQHTDSIRGEPILRFVIRSRDVSNLVLNIFMTSRQFSWNATYRKAPWSPCDPAANNRNHVQVLDPTTPEGQQNKHRLVQGGSEVLSLDEFFARYPAFSAKDCPLPPKAIAAPSAPAHDPSPSLPRRIWNAISGFFAWIASPFSSLASLCRRQ